MLGIFGVVFGGALTVGEEYMAGIALLVVGLAAMVRGVLVSRRPLRAIPTMAVGQHNDETLKQAQKSNTRSVSFWLRRSPWVSGGVIYASLTRGVRMGAFLAIIMVLGVVAFARSGALRRRYKREVRCPACMEIRLAVGVMNKNLEKTLEELAARWATMQAGAGTPTHGEDAPTTQPPTSTPQRNGPTQRR